MVFLADGNMAAAQRVALEEIVVTARKRNESLLEVPVAITAFTAANIEQNAIFDTRDVTFRTPSMNYVSSSGLAGGGRFNPNLTFRGMQNLTPVPQDQLGSAFLDGVFITGGPQSITTIDVERIEVLKGPQSTYFGRNTFSGAINYVTRTPGNEFQGRVQAELATYNTHRVSVSHEGPIIEDSLFYQVSVASYDKGAMYRSSTDGGELGAESTLQSTITLYATPTERTSIKLRGHIQENEDSNPQTAWLSGRQLAPESCDGFTWEGFDRAGNPATIAVDDARIDYFCRGTVPSLGEVGEEILSVNTSLNSPFYTANPNFSEIPILAQQGFTLRDVFIDNIHGDPIIADAPTLDHFGLIRRDYRLSLQADHEFENGISAFGSIAYSKADGNKIWDWDNSGIEAGYAIAPTRFDDIALESRLLSPQDERFRWLVGANYYDGEICCDFTGSTQLRVHFADLNGRNSRNEKVESKGVFASVEYDITDQIGGIAEVRYQEDKSVLVTTGTETPTFKEWIPRFILKYDSTDDVHLYASFSRGVLPGRINTGFVVATPFVRDQIIDVFGAVDEISPSDTLDNYELGLKQQAFDGRLQYSLTGYYARWNNKKVTASVPVQIDPNDPNSFNFVNNIIIPGKVEIKGVEFEGSVQLTDEWHFSGTLAYNDSKNIQVFNEGEAYFGTANFKGLEEPRNPKWSWSADTSYQDSFYGDWDWFARAEVYYKGKYFTDNANIGQMKSMMNVNARVGVQNQDWRIELFVTNLFDHKDWIAGHRSTDLAIPFGGQQFPTSIGVAVQAPDKRQFGLRSRFNF